jgi:hypothetical protein
MKLAELQVCKCAQMKQIVCLEIENISPILIEVTEIEIVQPSIVNIDISAFDFVVDAEFLVECFAEHPTTACNVDSFHGLSLS